MVRYVVKNDIGLYYKKCLNHGPVHNPNDASSWTNNIDDARIFEGISACKNSILGKEIKSSEWLEYEKVPFKARKMLGLERPTGPRVTRVMQEGLIITKVSLSEVTE